MSTSERTEEQVSGRSQRGCNSCAQLVGVGNGLTAMENIWEFPQEIWEHVTQQSTSEFMATTTPKLDLKGVWCFLSAVKGRYLEGTRGRKERRKNDVIHLNYKYV